MRSIHLFVGVLLSLTTATSVRAATYSVKDLGILSDLSGRTDARPNAISSKGVVAEANVTNGAYRALVLGSAVTNLGTLGGGESLAAGINESNRVVGYGTIAGGLTHGFVWTPGGTDGVSGNPQMKDLGTLGGNGNNSQALAINGSGQVTGYSDISSGQQHAIRYSGGTLSDIGKLLSSLPNSFGYGINAAGHIAGTAYDSGYAQPHAFFYDGSSAVEISSLGGQGASGMGINDGDKIAGYFTTTNGATHAFHYGGGVMTDLGTLGGDYSYGIGINNSDVIVGGSFTDANNQSYHAFVWANGSMQDLNRLVDATGTGWILVEARAINDAGQIVGIGLYGGSNHTFLLSPITSGLQTPRITAVKVNGGNVVISFTTVANASYVVQTTGVLPSSTWSNCVTGITGNGSVLSATNSGAGSGGRRFYRVEASTP